MRKLFWMGLLVLAACGPGEMAEEEMAVEMVEEVDGDEVAEDEDESTPLPEQCDAEDFRPLIGTASSEAGLIPTDMLRVYGENDIITQDYRPQRTNVIYDASGVIQRVECG